MQSKEVYSGQIMYDGNYSIAFSDLKAMDIIANTWKIRYNTKKKIGITMHESELLRI